MEYVLTHTSYTSDTSGQSDRRMRPQSAFVPSQSYYKQKGVDDDLGRPVTQHKPLAKGEFTQFSLAKVFEDDPGMRPKVFAPPTVNKVSYGLISHDISGATPVIKAAPNKARDTDPNAPRYVLPGSSSIPAAVATAAGTLTSDGADPSSSALTVRQMYQPPQPYQQTQLLVQQVQQQQQQPHQQPPLPPPQQQRLQTRDTLNVADINTVTSVVERPDRMATRTTQLNVRDVEGSWPGWEPPFRSHVGKNLRDPGLDVTDISGTFRRRRVFSARPNLGSSRDRGFSGAGGAAAVAAPPPASVQLATSRGEPAAVAAAQEQEPAAASAPPPQQQGQGHLRQPAQSYLPPPMMWQPVGSGTEAVRQHRASGSEGSSSGGSGGATRRYSHPVRQSQRPLSAQQPPEPAQTSLEQQQEQSNAAHAAGAWPTSVTLPLRPSLQPPPFATYIPTGSVAAVLSASLDAPTASRTAAVADHPAATVGKAAPGKRDPKARHSAKLVVADVQRADAAEAHRVISALRPSREAVEEFFSSCRRLDRETCGKVTPTDFVHALERANLLSSLSAPATATAAAASGAASGSTGVAEPAAAAVALARGLQDGCGMVSYRYLAKALLGQTSTEVALRSSLTAVATAPPPALAKAAAAAAATISAQEPVSSAPAALLAEAPTAASALTLPQTPFATAAGAAGNALKPSLARQTSDPKGCVRPATEEGTAAAGAASAAAAAAATTTSFNSVEPPAGMYDASAAALAASAAASRRSVSFAAEPAAVDVGQVAEVSAAAAAVAPPPSAQHLEDVQRIENQERQLRREGSQRRRPFSAMPGGGAKGAGAVAAVFKLLGAPQPILYDTPAPAAAAAPATPPVAASAASARHQTGPGTSVASNVAVPAARHTPPKADSPPPEAEGGGTAVPYDGMGFGPHWPPEPNPNNLQKRSASTIMDAGNFELRDVCDVTYFPYKAHAMWFSGRAPVGPDGTEATGGPAEAAREYQPSVDPVSMLVGRGHHRIGIPPTGHKLEPEVEAAIVARLRPPPGLGSTPEATARARTVASVVQQLNVDNPLLYPGNLDPTAPAGAALKGMLGCLYTAGNGTSSVGGAGSGGGGTTSLRASTGGSLRPSTAGARRSAHPRSSSVSKSVSVFSGSGASGAIAAAGSAAAGGGGGSVRVGRAALERQMHREEIAAVRRLC